MGLINLFSLVGGLTLIIGLSTGFRQEIWFYNGYDPATSDHLYFQSNVPDLTKYKTEDLVSVCARGSWHLFSYPHYISRSYWVGRDDTDELRCLNISAIGVGYKSARHFGPIETEIEALSLYHNMDLQGNETLILDDYFESTEVTIFSFAATGIANWTLFEFEGYTGRSFCFRGPTGDKFVSYGSGPNWGTRSGRKGC